MGITSYKETLSLVQSRHLMRAITSVITAVESDGWDSFMVQKPIVSNERHNLGRHCL